MSTLWVSIEAGCDETQLMVTSARTGAALRARLPALPSQPQALTLLLQGLSAWFGEPLTAVVAADKEGVLRLSLAKTRSPCSTCVDKEAEHVPYSPAEHLFAALSTHADFALENLGAANILGHDLDKVRGDGSKASRSGPPRLDRHYQIPPPHRIAPIGFTGQSARTKPHRLSTDGADGNGCGDRI